MGDVTASGSDATAIIGYDDNFSAHVELLLNLDVGTLVASGSVPGVEFQCPRYHDRSPAAGEATGDGVQDLIIPCNTYMEGFVSLYEGPISTERTTSETHTRFYTTTETDFGHPISVDGDMDGDGRNEFLIRSFRHLFAYSDVVSGEVLDTDADTVINGDTAFGHAFTSGFDDNQDGYTDLLVSDPSWIPYSDNCRHQGVGAAWLFHGPLSGDMDAEGDAVASIRDSNRITADVTDCLGGIGSSLAALDVQGEGQTDYVIGNAGVQLRASVYLVQGPLSGTIDLDTNTLQLLTGYNSHQTAQVLVEENLDEDDMRDLVIADPGWIPPEGDEQWGSVYLYPGADIVSLAGW